MGTIRRVVIAATVATIAVLAVGVVPAHAQPTSEDIARCTSAPDLDGFEGADSTCTYTDAEGNTHTVSIQGRNSSSQPTVGAGMIVLAVLWWLIPVFAAPYVAQRRGESIVIALALAMVLGWIGLALVFAFQRPRVAMPGPEPTPTLRG